jgi:predicted AAA+ superfamily ATPase
MIKRIIEDKIKQLAEKFPVISVTGPRQSGKTTYFPIAGRKGCYTEFNAT